MPPAFRTLDYTDLRMVIPSRMQWLSALNKYFTTLGQRINDEVGQEILRKWAFKGCEEDFRVQFYKIGLAQFHAEREPTRRPS